MSEGFGARLRRRREEQGIALLTIAGHTKIKLSLLEGLERDDVSQWPTGIFRRAYIRSYAQAIGLDPDTVAGEFQEVSPDPGDVVTTEAIVATLDATRTSAGPPTRLRFIVGSALGSLARFRRTPEVAQVEIAEPVSAAAATSGQPDLPLAADPLADLWQVENTPETEEAPVEVPASIELESPEVAPSGADREQPAPAPFQPDFAAVAAVCTELGRAGSADAVQLSLQQAAGVLDATGIIVWLWDEWADGLRPALVHGYADAVVAQLPIVRCDADNATAAAFRSARTCAIDGDPDASGALAVPLLTADGCAGVLAIELQHGRAQLPSVRAAATIFAAQLAPLAGRPRRDRSGSDVELSVPVDDPLTSGVRS